MIEEKDLVPCETSNLPNGDWIVFAPHHDDETIGMGGSLILAKEQNIKVTLVIVTDGSQAGDRDTREKESQKVAQKLGIEEVIFLRETDRNIIINDDLVKSVAQIIDKSNANNVFFPSPMELHPDHRMTTELVWNALEQANIKPNSYAYEITVQNQVNYLVDISNVMNKKKSLLKIYQSQLKENDYLDFMVSMNRLRAYTLPRKIKYVEGFYYYGNEYNMDYHFPLILSLEPFTRQKFIEKNDKTNLSDFLLDKKDIQIMALNTTIKQTNKQVIELNEVVQTKDKQVIELNEVVQQKEKQVIELNEVVQTKDKQVIELNEVVQTKDKQVIELNEVVQTKDKQVIELNALAHKQQDHTVSLVEDIKSKNILLNEYKMQLMENIDLSIVTNDSTKWLDSFFNSLINQNYPLNKLSLYITDNSSTDDTYDYLKNLQNKYINIFASFNLRKEKNLGFGHGHNNNFKYAKSKFILATNVDLEFEKDSIVNIVDYALKDDSSTASWEFRQKPYEHPKYYNPVTLETTWSSSACILFRKEAIDKIGGYDEHIFMYGEDVELSYRLRDFGYKLKYYPKAVCWHYTYAEANQIKEVQYFGSTFANVLIRMRYGTKAEIMEGLKLYKGLLNIQGLFWNQRRKQLRYFLRLIRKAPYFLFNRKRNKENTYKILNWDYEFIRDGAFYEYPLSKQNKNPLVSVVMRTCCERNDFLQEAIESVKNQTYTNIELVVIEDGTTNAAVLMQNVKSDNISNVIYRSIEKAGRCHAGNAGLEATNGEYIVFLDDDDLFFADHLEVLVQEITDNPSMGACYSSSFEVSTDVISKEPLQYEEKLFSVLHREEFSKETILHHNFIPIQSILFKRSLYEEYGGFDEELDNLEDWNLWTRYSYLNDFKFVDKTTSLYRVPACSEISSARQDELDRYYQIAVKKQKEFIASLDK